ncbi:uncharacterized protein LOC120632752 [Pararge aegeria]|uniref:uncharacterized protein LOC120632752 n=1 Tax=Pararge aegeria TaxID=116150 RepID=UPI0019D0E34B|nr:uncharacterized protein LOC120632752 [Pararge aegeria]
MYFKGKNIILRLILNLSLLLPVSLSDLSLDELMLHRSRRQLLFPNSTLLQVNIGVGTPTPIKTINVNWAIQCNFQLPWNRTQIPVDIFGANSGYVGTARKKREAHEDYTNDAKLYHFYQYVEDMLSSFGYNGTSCVLRTLCQLGTEPLQATSDEDLLHEIASFTLNPLNDGLEESTEDSAPYIHAYEAGRTYQDCFAMYNDCHISLIDVFTSLH